MIEESIEDNDPRERMFAVRVCNPLAWFHHSRSLIAAARATVERTNVLIDFDERFDLENVCVYQRKLPPGPGTVNLKCVNNGGDDLVAEALAYLLTTRF